MSEEIFLTIQQVADKTGLAKSTIHNYVSRPDRVPHLPTTYEKHEGTVQAVVKLSDFESWWMAYKAKKPFGARLHANVGRKRAVKS